MTFKQTILHIWNNPKDTWYYIQGNIRYKLWYSKYSWLIRKHIREQIDMRIKSMNRECYNSGSCINCGCKTTHLQMCNKSCKGDCYPKMMNKKQWEEAKKKTFTHDYMFAIRNGKFINILKDNGSI